MSVAQPLSMFNASNLSVRSFSSLYLQDLRSLPSKSSENEDILPSCGLLYTPQLNVEAVTHQMGLGGLGVGGIWSSTLL